jgi:hypothetical protein
MHIFKKYLKKINAEILTKILISAKEKKAVNMNLETLIVNKSI